MKLKEFRERLAALKDGFIKPEIHLREPAKHDSRFFREFQAVQRGFEALRRMPWVGTSKSPTQGNPRLDLPFETGLARNPKDLRTRNRHNKHWLGVPVPGSTPKQGTIGLRIRRCGTEGYTR